MRSIHVLIAPLSLLIILLRQKIRADEKEEQPKSIVWFNSFIHETTPAFRYVFAAMLCLNIFFTLIFILANGTMLSDFGAPLKSVLRDEPEPRLKYLLFLSRTHSLRGAIRCEISILLPLFGSRFSPQEFHVFPAL
jgi:hypothetical protein